MEGVLHRSRLPGLGKGGAQQELPVYKSRRALQERGHSAEPAG